MPNTTPSQAKVWTAVEIADKFTQWKLVPTQFVELVDYHEAERWVLEALLAVIRKYRDDFVVNGELDVEELGRTLRRELLKRQAQPPAQEGKE